jgi:hypothetical protein
MRKPLKKDVHVRHVSNHGDVKERLVYGALDAWYDDLFSIANKPPTPAVRIVYGEGREYNVINLVDPATVITRIKTGVGLIEVGLDDFDPTVIPDEAAFFLLAEAFPDASKAWWNKCFMRAKFIHKFWEKTKYHPKEGHPDDLLLCAYTLPTPRLPTGVTKLQYFKFLHKIS